MGFASKCLPYQVERRCLDLVFRALILLGVYLFIVTSSIGVLPEVDCLLPETAVSLFLASLYLESLPWEGSIISYRLLTFAYKVDQCSSPVTFVKMTL